MVKISEMIIFVSLTTHKANDIFLGILGYQRKLSWAKNQTIIGKLSLFKSVIHTLPTPRCIVSHQYILCTINEARSLLEEIEA